MNSFSRKENQFIPLCIYYRNKSKGGLSMPFGYSTAIFPHPSVQYIPLYPQQSYELQHRLHLTQPRLFIFTHPRNLPSLQSRLQLSQALPPWKQNCFLLVLCNSRLHTLYYRGQEVRGVGEKEARKVTFWFVTPQYFYHRHLLFSIFSKEAHLLARARCFVQLSP